MIEYIKDEIIKIKKVDKLDDYLIYIGYTKETEEYNYDFENGYIFETTYRKYDCYNNKTTIIYITFLNNDTILSKTIEYNYYDKNHNK